MVKEEWRVQGMSAVVGGMEGGGRRGIEGLEVGTTRRTGAKTLPGLVTVVQPISCTCRSPAELVSLSRQTGALHAVLRYREYV